MFEVDAVITWVDGADPVHRAKRERHLALAQADAVAQARAPLHDNGTNPHRWLCSDELNYCVRSIANNAPWVRQIWIVTDAQTPEIMQLPPEIAAKISIVDHREIFAGYDDALPTFNSLSIETMLWRIPGLAEHFLYFNDDVFLTAPVTRSDFFAGDGPVLRGQWADHSDLVAGGARRDDASMLNHFNQINAAQMIGYTADQVFESAHVVHPMQRSVMAQLFDTYRNAFISNASFRFRDAGQFLPQSLHNHACLADGAPRYWTRAIICTSRWAQWMLGPPMMSEAIYAAANGTRLNSYASMTYQKLNAASPMHVCGSRKRLAVRVLSNA